MNQDGKRVESGIRSTAYSAGLACMLFEINHLPDDYDHAGKHARNRLTKRQDRFEKEIRP